MKTQAAPPYQAPLLFLSIWLSSGVCVVMATDAVNVGAVLGSSGQIRAAPSIAAVLAIVLGAIVCTYGYKLLRPAIFLCGFMAGGLLVAIIIEYAFASFSWMVTASWIGFLVGGAAVGSLAVTLYKVGVTLVGAVAGGLLAFMLNTSFGHSIFPSNPDAMLIILIILLAAIGAFLAWKIERLVLIIATSFIGADALVWGIGYFAGSYPSAADLKSYRSKNSAGDWVYHIPGAWWAYLTATLLLFALGMYVQFRKTAAGVTHRSAHAVATPPASSAYQSVATPRHGQEHGPSQSV